MSMKKKEWEKFPEHIKKQIRKHLNENKNKNARSADTKPKRSGRETLVVEGKTPTSLVNLTGEVIVRITRVSPRRLDDDNLSGGCKQLRDAIASLLGRKGDSEKDGLRWIYEQEKGKAETIIEIMEN